MWALAFAIYAGCKGLTWWKTPAPRAPAWRQAAYLLLWPGMDAREFLDPGVRPERPAAREWIAGAVDLVAGAVLCFAVARVVVRDRPLLAGWIGMVALVLVLHFGSFALLSCAWRRAGVAARPLMDRPLLAASVGDFWGRRWNTAFRDLTHRFLFRPLARRLGPRAGIAAGFLVSGLVHDAVISLPARGGWGGRAFALLVVALPAPLLLHRPFVENVIVPFLRAAGALP
jgi:alginate O-acetyltransferase complex protein AlgI